MITDYEKGCNWCHGYGMLLLLFVFGYCGVLYHYLARYFGKTIGKQCSPFRGHLRTFRNTRQVSVYEKTFHFILSIAF